MNLIRPLKNCLNSLQIRRMQTVIWQVVSVHPMQCQHVSRHHPSPGSNSFLHRSIQLSPLKNSLQLVDFLLKNFPVSLRRLKNWPNILQINLEQIQKQFNRLAFVLQCRICVQYLPLFGEPVFSSSDNSMTRCHFASPRQFSMAVSILTLFRLRFAIVATV